MSAAGGTCRVWAKETSGNAALAKPNSAKPVTIDVVRFMMVLPMGCLRRCARANAIEFFNMIARRGHPRCHCNKEGFGTLSRQLGNVEGYRSSRAGVSGCFTPGHASY